eukprot:Skav224358  [mRNA]  locus=scaffold5095:6778:15991:+ [translate_table: standard]
MICALCRASSASGDIQCILGVFEAGKPRKTKDFIGDEIILRSSSRQFVPLWEAPTDVDPRLLDEERTMQAIIQQLQCQDHFLRRRFCSCCPFFRSRVPNPSKETILVFLNKIAESLYFCKQAGISDVTSRATPCNDLLQVVVLCAIYIERLLQRAGICTDTVLTPGNWRSLVTAGMLISSKVWEDIHPWNADFEECLVEIAGRWRVFVDGEIYAAYFFSLQEGRQHSVQSSAGPRARKTQRLQRHAPRALAPSKHIQQSEDPLRIPIATIVNYYRCQRQELLWAHKLAAKTTELSFPQSLQSLHAHTLSGATGNQLQTELLQYLSKKRGEDRDCVRERLPQSKGKQRV